MNKKNIGFLFTILCALVLLQLAPNVEAADSSPVIYDSTYIDKIQADLKAADTSLQKQLTDTQTQLTAAQTELAAVKDSMVFKIIKLPAGKTLVGGASTEIIVRNKNRVTAYVASTATGGVSNLISGTDIKNGEIVPDNQLLLIPKDDGRGITAKADADIMIKGMYTIK